MADLTQSQIIDLLRQHSEAGCDAVLADAPINHYEAAVEVQAKLSAEARAPVPAPTSIQEPDMPAATQHPAAPDAPPAVARPVTLQAATDTRDGVKLAEAAASSAGNLAELQTAMQNFDACPLKATAKNTVFADGRLADNGESRIMLVGEAPGQDEDREGRPFVGVSGQLLDAMLAAIGLSRDTNLYISNIVPWRPPGNRTPSLDEIAICTPFITRHIELAQPDILLLVGNIANKALLDTQTGITKLRGQWQSYTHGEMTLEALPLLHPAYVLRRPETKANMWADLCALKQKILNA